MRYTAKTKRNGQTYIAAIGVATLVLAGSAPTYATPLHPTTFTIDNVPQQTGQGEKSSPGQKGERAVRWQEFIENNLTGTGDVTVGNVFHHNQVPYDNNYPGGIRSYHHTW
jgi:hypothetical protein